jgi:gas vesicle protein
MKYALSFLAGAIFGASLALLLAPETGDDLRSKIKHTAESGISKAQQDLQQVMSEAQVQMDKISADMKGQVEKLSGELQALESKVKEAARSS